MTRVFVVILDKDDRTVMLGATNRVESRSKDETTTDGVRLVLRKTWDNPPFTMVHLSDEVADQVFHEEFSELVRIGYTVRGEPLVVTMPDEPWDGDQIEMWAGVVFNRAEAGVTFP